MNEFILMIRSIVFGYCALFVTGFILLMALEVKRNKPTAWQNWMLFLLPTFAGFISVYLSHR